MFAIVPRRGQKVVMEAETTTEKNEWVTTLRKVIDAFNYASTEEIKEMNTVVW